MKLEHVLINLHPSDFIGRKSWRKEGMNYTPHLHRSPEGFVKRNMEKQNELIYEPYELTDEDRLADDWMIVQ